MKRALIIPVAVMIVGLMASSVAMADTLQTRQPLTTDLQTIMNVLRPINIYQVDLNARHVFDDFFEQKSRIYHREPVKEAGNDLKPGDVIQPPRKRPSLRRL